MATAVLTKRKPPLPPAARVFPDLHRFTLDQYHEMGRHGILTEDDRVELLHGLIIQKMTIKPAHAYTVDRLVRLLGRLLDDDWAVRGQQPITIPPEESEPEPDVAVAVGPDARYMHRHPAPKEVALVIEVADSTLADDRGVKYAIYAGARIPVYWIVNLPDRLVEVYSRPRGGSSPTYRGRSAYGPGESVPLVLAGKDRGVIPVREILPR